jgi:hypothetical protein
LLLCCCCVKLNWEEYRSRGKLYTSSSGLLEWLELSVMTRAKFRVGC